jgi:cell wall assembly regulator SMI1
MLDLIKNYFRNTNEYQNEFNSPAAEEQIVDLEKQLEITLPSDYKDFLRFTNGFDGQIGEFIVIFDPVETIYNNTRDNCSEFFPWAVYIGTNGNIEMYVIDKRKQPYQFGVLPFIADDNDFIPLGDTFEKLIANLYNDTVFGQNK